MCIRDRPEALLIKPAEGKTFAEVLTQVRRDANPASTGTEIRSIRRTRSEDVLLELGSKTTNKEGFCEALRGVLGESASVRSLEPRITLEIRDLDCLTTEEEVRNAVKRDEMCIRDRDG